MRNVTTLGTGSRAFVSVTTRQAALGIECDSMQKAAISCALESKPYYDSVAVAVRHGRRSGRGGDRLPNIWIKEETNINVVRSFGLLYAFVNVVL